MTPHLIEKARSNRARCRACSGSIAKDELRLGVAQAQENGGHSHIWLHLACAPADRALELEEALAATSLPIPHRAALDAAIAAAKAGMPARTRPYAAAGSGLDTFHCTACGSWSFPSSLRVFLPGQVVAGNQTFDRDLPYDPKCARTTLGDPNLLQTLLANSALAPQDEQWLRDSLP